LLINNKLEHKHYSAGLRIYYKNVTNFHKENFIELHFFKAILPGYLWIFPLPNNEANVGIGMLSSYVSKKKVNLKKVLQDLIKTHPNLKERFKNAEPLETIKGFGLPLGSKKRKISSNRVLLLGDAAGLIDPFSGEGIANAIRSGRVAAEHLKQCIKLNDFSAKMNLNYDKEIYRLMQKEFKISRTLQNLCKYPRLFNYIVNKANKNNALREFLIGTLEDVEKKKMLTKPSFYYRLFFK
jgi:flavin-dependent dehydrogenase